MNKKDIEHVKNCREMLNEEAQELGLKVSLKEYKFGEKNINAIEIIITDQKNNFIYRSLTGDVGNIIGFLNGYAYNKTKKGY